MFSFHTLILSAIILACICGCSPYNPAEHGGNDRGEDYVSRVNFEPVDIDGSASGNNDESNSSVFELAVGGSPVESTTEDWTSEGANSDEGSSDDGTSEENGPENGSSEEGSSEGMTSEEDASEEQSSAGDHPRGGPNENSLFDAGRGNGDEGGDPGNSDGKNKGGDEVTS